MRRIRRPAVLLMAGLLVLTGALVAQAIGSERSAGGPPLVSTDKGPGGALALASWLERMGYPVERQYRVDRDSGDRRIWFVLEPLRPFELHEAQSMLAWIEAGGTLVYVPSRFQIDRLGIGRDQPENHLEDLLGASAGSGGFFEEGTGWPVFFGRTQPIRFFLDTWRTIESTGDAWVPIITAPDGSHVAATRSLGGGHAYMVTSDALFSNRGIGRLDNRAFLLAILARHGSDAGVVFDEDHHSIVGRPQLMEVARTSPWGWAAGYAALLTFLFLLWGGRRFGPALVVSGSQARSTGEYVTAFAGLLRRVRAAAWVQSQYAQLYRRHLARDLGISAEVPVDRLARLYADRRGLDPGTLESSIRSLEGAALSEEALLAQVRALEHVLSEPRRFEAPETAGEPRS